MHNSRTARSMTKIISSFSENGSYWASESVSHRMPSTFWRRLLLPLMALAWSIALGPSPLFAQNIQHTENKPDLALRSDIRVDPSTLGMSFSIPLTSYPGRAGHGLPVAITYSSKVLRLDFQGVDSPPISGPITKTGVEFAEHSTAGWTSTLTPPRVEFTGMGQFFNGQGHAACPDVCVPGQTTVGDHYIKRIHVHMPDGSSHELRLDDQTYLFPVQPFTGTFHAVDSSRMRFESNAGAASVLYLPDGSRYLFGPYNDGNELTATHFIDRNGNTLTYNASTREWTDTLNRVIPNPLPTNPAANTETYFLAKLVGGADATYTLRWKNLADVLTPDPATGQPPPLRYPGNVKCAPNSYPSVSPSLFTSSSDTKVCVEKDQVGNPLLFNPVVLAEVVLPTGKFYRFTYTVYGEIDKILLPTGATDRFRYDPVATLSSSTAPYTQTNRGVIERRVSATGSGTDESLWTYAVISADPYTVRTTRPDLSYSERLLHRSRYTGIGENFARFEFDDARMGMAYEERSYNSSGVMLRRVLSKWVEGGLTAGGYSEARDPKVTKQVSIILDGPGSNASTATSVNRYEQLSQPLNLTSTTQYGYDSSMSKTTAQVASVDTFNPADSLAIRTTETAYLDNASYNARNLVSLPISIAIKTGMPLSGVVKARSEMLYDDITLLSCGATVGWTSPGTAPRANVTTVRSWLSTLGAFTNTNAYLATRTQYDQCGSVRKLWDARDTALSNPTQIEYSHQFAYPTLNTSADPDGVGPLLPLTTSTEYDVSTGLVTATMDANGQRTSFSFNDPLSRLTQVIRAATDAVAKNQSTYSYDDTARTITATSDLNTYGDNLLKTVTVYDGLGRTVETRSFEGGTNYIATQQQYDTSGRAFKISNPFRPWQSETPVWTTTTYDALSRVLTTTTPDNSVATTSYSGNTVTVTDQIARKRKSVTDALGRLTDVYEDPLGVNYQTTYSYDVLDNLTGVTQGTQTRTFVYDSLKRLTSATNPESGTVSYQYDNNGNLTQKTDARSIVTTYAYDALNRNTTINYSDTATNPDITRVYDTATNGKGRPRESYAGGTESAGTNVEHTKIVSYDALGRPKDQRQRFKTSSVWSAEFKTLRAYNLAGDVTSQTYPSGHTINYSYDSAGRMNGFTGNLGDGVTRTYATAVTYSPFGGKQQEQFGTQTPLYHKLHYNVRGQLNDIRLSTVSWQTDQWNWNRGALINYYSQTEVACQTHQCRANSGPGNNGNIIQAQHWVPANDQITSYNWTEDRYTYDSLNRLEAVAEYHGSPSGLSAQDFTQIFDYDRWGNRMINPATTNGMPETQFTVLANNRLSVPVGQTGRMDYDAAGNLINDTYTSYGRTDGTPTRLYDAENRLTTAKDTNLQVVSSYSYNANGQRTRRKVGGLETWQVYSIDAELLAEYALNAATFVPTKEYGYRNGELLVTVSSGDDQRLRRFVQNLYYGALQRDPTSQELTTKTNELATAGAQSQAQLLVKVKEIARALFVQTTYETNPLRSDTQYVTDLYYAYLQRGPDAGGLGWWVPQAAGSVQNRINVLNAFEAAGEFQTLVNTLYGTGTSDDQRTQNLITNFYQGALGRPPNSTELATNSATVNSAAAQGQSQVISAAETMGRSLFAAQVNDASLSNTQYVTNLYEGFLQRGPDAGGLGFWSGQATVGQGRQNVLNAFAASIAFRELAGTLYREVYWLVADHLGTPRMVVNKAGTLAGIKRHDYLPFGEELYAGVGGRTTALGYTSDTIRQKFTQKERDNETGLDYFLARYYSQPQGRFTSIDPENHQAMNDLNDPQSWNAYSYVNNNPLCRVDPDGRGILSKLKNWLLWDVWGEEEDVKRVQEQKRAFLIQLQMENPNHELIVQSPITGQWVLLHPETMNRSNLWLWSNAVSSSVSTRDLSPEEAANVLDTAMFVSPALKGDPYHPDSVAERQTTKWDPWKAQEARKEASSLGAKLVKEFKEAGAGQAAGRSGGHGAPYARAGAELIRRAGNIRDNPALKEALLKEGKRLQDYARSVSHK